MEDEPFVELRYAFRFLRLNRSQAETAAAHFPGGTIRDSRDSSSFVVSFWVSEETDFDWIEQFIRKEEISEEHYDFFISTLTDSDTRIVSMPPYLVDLLRRIGGRVEFSFTVV